jgi:hypothetical protein
MTLDRSAIMKDAWRRYRDSQRLGLGFDFARCLRLSWTAAKIRAVVPRKRYNPEPLELAA